MEHPAYAHPGDVIKYNICVTLYSLHCDVYNDNVVNQARRIRQYNQHLVIARGALQVRGRTNIVIRVRPRGGETHYSAAY